MPLLLRADLSRSAVRAIVALCQITCDLRISFTSFTTLSADVDALLSGPTPAPASQSIIKVAAAHSPASIHDIVTASAIAGKRRMLVDHFAISCGWSTRTLESRLRVAGSIAAKEFLAWSLVLHTAWRIEILERAPKQAAYAAGFESSAALGGYLNRHVGVRSRGLSLPGTFGALLGRFGDALEARGRA